jgi:DNA-binding LytR/AlgR family response regulator
MMTPFFVWQNRILKKIHPEDVVALDTEGNYTRILLSNNTHYMVRSTLSNALKKLPPDIFFKVHRSTAVSVYHIDKIHRDHLITGRVSLPIGKQYYQALLERLNIIE